MTFKPFYLAWIFAGFLFLNSVFASSVCNHSLILLSNDTGYILTVSRLDYSPMTQLNVRQGEQIAENSQRAIYIHTKRFFIFEGHMNGQLDFKVADKGLLHITYSILDTVDRTPDFECRVYHSKAWVTGIPALQTRVTADPSEEEKAARIQVQLSEKRSH